MAFSRLAVGLPILRDVLLGLNPEAIRRHDRLPTIKSSSLEVPPPTETRTRAGFEHEVHLAAQEVGPTVTFKPSSSGPNLIWQDKRLLLRLESTISSNASSISSGEPVAAAHAGST
jgi:hypothetical protein